ncbi:transcription initiation factor IIF, beta subunit-domain-containing protein [Cercophora newfieldiana]|uniref:Transcription initiation factor IIF subunit beta n=1 Tax=Cercophora newfieldiana TaxID=92897 RepID=A0AA40D1I9_9PEZI|nr:transcription initiation factor IIF, beta subunit-domain-containing protein [Cercophora newfieldiana]
MADPVRIKSDPDANSPGAEDELDESTDLEFYNKAEQGGSYDRMYLARLPNYLWERWAELGDNDEIQIGMIRQWKAPDGQTKLQMRLENLTEHKDLPKEYNMEIANPDVHNTFVFSEQDLPSYAAKNKERAAALAQGIPAHLLRQQQRQTEPQQPADRQSRRAGPYTRRAIPKKTTIAGTIRHELICTPVQNAETDFVLATRALQKQAPKKVVQIEDKLPPVGSASQSREWENFMKTGEVKLSKAKKMDNKTARWPENKLIDAIAECFSEYKYWAIKTLRTKIPQPEAFIREGLEKVAVLHRSGAFANHWSLRPEYQGMIANKNLPQPAADSAAPASAVDFGSDDEDDDVKMEDVVF